MSEPNDTGEPTLKSHRGGWLSRRDVRFLLFVAIVVGGFHLWGYIAGPGRITERLAEQLNAGHERYNIVVTSKFPPEAFHMNVYQQLGSMRGSTGATATLHRVRASGVRQLSRDYWIESIDLAERAD